MKARYTVLDGEILAQERSGVKHDYVPDPLGSVIALYDTNQTKTDTFSYWPYGDVKSRTGSTPTHFGFEGTGGYYADVTGRCYVRARHLSTAKGCWMTPELPLYMSWGASPYYYCGGNPTSYVDPSGAFRVSGPPQRSNCKNVVYLCHRPTRGFEVIPHHFIWIRNECTGRESTISYGPAGGYPPPYKPPEQPDDLGAIRSGTARCWPTDCDPRCIQRFGGMIRYGAPYWDPNKYYPRFPMGNCWDFADLAMDGCGCDTNGRPFTPNPIPPRPRTQPSPFPPYGAPPVG